MIGFPNIKINLGLRITGKRADGYHSLESIFYPVGWCDILEIIHSHEFEFSSSGISIPGDNQQNLVVKAYNLLSADFDLSPVKIHLHKTVPTGSGLGAGSSDGSFALKLLNDLFKLQLTELQLLSYAEKLGSDCPFFIANRPRLVTGRGEILSETAISLKDQWIKIVQPGFHFSTKEAFDSLNSTFKPSVAEQWKNLSPQTFSSVFINDFEQGITQKFPELENLKSHLIKEGAYFVSLSGSGSAFYGLFSEEPKKSGLGKYEFITRLT